MDGTYKAWLRGLKTTYYLRTQSATRVQMSTMASLHHNAVDLKLEKATTIASNLSASDVQFCAIDLPVCKAFQ